MFEFEPTALMQITALIREYGLAFFAGVVFGTVSTGATIIAKLRRDGIL